MTILTERSAGVSRQNYREGEIIFSQGEPAKGLFYIRQGKVRKIRISISGKARVIAVLGPQEFFGTKCVVDDSSERDCTVSAMTECSVACIDKATMVRALREQPGVAGKFIAFLIDRNCRYEGDLASHLFNSSSCSSQFETWHSRALTQGQGLRAKLGGPDWAGYCGDDPPKPKWMRWKTYNRILERSDRYEAIADDRLVYFVARLLKGR